MKGISPLVGAVLLIAFTMVVSTIFAQWAPALTSSLQDKTYNSSEEVRKCSGLGIEIKETDLSSDVASITVQQVTGGEAIGNLTVTWFYSNTAVQNQTSIDSPRGVIVVRRNREAGKESVDRVRVDPANCEGAAPDIYQP